MKEYEKKQAFYIVELENGGLVVLNKEDIKTRFCFGYYEDETSQNNAVENRERARNDARLFINENLKSINDKIKCMENMEDERGNEPYIYGKKYYGDLEESLERGITRVKPRELETEKKRFEYLEKLGEEDKKRILEGLYFVKADLGKRLATYLKKYGLSKIYAWTFYAND